MEPIKRKDYILPCDSCGATGLISYKDRQGGWGGSKVWVSNTCSKCGGKKKFLDKDRYIGALERRLKNIQKHFKNFPMSLSEEGAEEVKKWHLRMKEIFGISEDK